MIPGPGTFFAPTVLVDLHPDSHVLHEEIFGPVAPFITFSSESEVVKRANATPYGLVAFLHTTDPGRAERVSSRLEAGMVAINSSLTASPVAPFGGVKQSGLGREGGLEALEEYLEFQTLTTREGP